MIQKLKLVTAFLLFFYVSCKAQKTVQIPADAKKLQTNKTEFIGKTFKDLLCQVTPEIGYIYGTPDNKNANGNVGTFIKFFFQDRSKYQERIRAGENPIGVTVDFKFEPNNIRMVIPKGGVNSSKKYLIENYGDMIIQNIYVTGQE